MSSRSVPTGPKEAMSWERVGLAVLSGGLLGLSFPPSSIGLLACVGLVPLLLALEGINSTSRGLRIVYVAMLVFHAITLSWTGGFSEAKDPYMMIAGSATILIHPLFYFLPMGAFLLVRKHLGRAIALGGLPFLWVGYEYSHMLSEWSFPWLTLGNSQTYSLAQIQYVSVTGVLGVSFWIVVLNVILLQVISVMMAERGPTRQKQLVAWSAIFVVTAILPTIQGTLVLSSASEVPIAGKAMTVGMVQTNADPWEKWTGNDWGVIAGLEEMTDSLLHESRVRRPDLILWPETAIPVYLLAPENAALYRRFRRWVDTSDISLLSGLLQVVVYPDSTRAPRGAKRTRGGGLWYETFNAEALFTSDIDKVPWYGKMKMVPLAERIPYAEVFSSFDFLRWGVGIGGWAVGRDTVIFTERRTGVRFASLICYESVYPDFVAQFVRKGAQFIAIITIDSWWGKMSGAYQHKQFAVLRAIENRRWIARCALGGISCYIDPFGRTYDATPLLSRAVLNRTFPALDEMTFYTRNGDWVGHISLLAAGLLVAAAFGQAFTARRRRIT